MALIDDVMTIIDEQQSFANQKASTGLSVIVAAANTLLSQNIEIPDEFKTQIGNLADYVQSNKSLRNLSDINASIVLPNEPSLIEPTPVTDLKNAGPRPEVDHEVGDYDKPSSIAPFNLNPPNINTNVDNITVPTYPVPDPPEFLPINEIDPPPDTDIPNDNITLPVYEGNIPDDLPQQYLDAFRQLHGELDQQIRAGLNDVVNAFFPKLETQTNLVDEYICAFMNGDETALSNITEDAIYSRGQNRIDAQFLREYDEARLLAVETGNPVMQPRMRSSLLRVTENAAIRNAEHTLGTAEQRAIRELEQLRFCMTMVKELRDSAVNLRNQEFQNALAVNQLANQIAIKYVDLFLDVARLYIEKLNADIRNANLALEKLKQDREFILIQLEIYKARLEGENIKANTNQTLASTYATEVRVLEILYNVVNIQANIIRTEVEIRKLPAEIYEINANAYVAYTRGALAETEVFKALISGDLAQIQGQVAELEGWIKGREADQLEIQIVDSYNNALSRYNDGLIRIHGFQAALLELEKRLETVNIENERLGLQGDIAEFTTESQANLQQYTAENRTAIAVTQLQADLVTAYERIRQGFEGLVLERNKAVAQVYSAAGRSYEGMATAALSGLNTLASAGDNLNRTE